MKVNGHRLRQRINECESVKAVLSAKFTDAKSKFPDEEKAALTDIARQFEACDIRIARLQDIQTRYNLHVMVTVHGQTFSLREAVARLGGAGRLEKMWRSVATPSARDRYSYNSDTRDPNQIVSAPTMNSDDALDYLKRASRFASDLRSAIANANTIEIDVRDLPGVTFDLSTLD